MSGARYSIPLRVQHGLRGENTACKRSGPCSGECDPAARPETTGQGGHTRTPIPSCIRHCLLAIGLTDLHASEVV